MSNLLERRWAVGLLLLSCLSCGRDETPEVAAREPVADLAKAEAEAEVEVKAEAKPEPDRPATPKLDSPAGPLDKLECEGKTDGKTVSLAADLYGNDRVQRLEFDDGSGPRTIEQPQAFVLFADVEERILAIAPTPAASPGDAVSFAAMPKTFRTRGGTTRFEGKLLALAFDTALDCTMSQGGRP